MLFESDEREASRKISPSIASPLIFAVRVFLDPYRMDSEDKRRDYSEERRLTPGTIEGRLYAVACTVRDKIIRLISARKANQREQRKYHETLPT
jgi:uncharacterized DUF497 family protein